MTEEIVIRGLQDGDVEFIYATWLKHYKYSAYSTRRIRHSIYFDYHHDVVERILERKPLIRIACSHDDKDLVLGYLVAEGNKDFPLIHFCYVKAPFRNMGIGKRLVEGLNLRELTFTHWTYDVDWLISKIPSATYNPYRV